MRKKEILRRLSEVQKENEILSQKLDQLDGKYTLMSRENRNLQASLRRKAEELDKAQNILGKCEGCVFAVKDKRKCQNCRRNPKSADKFATE